MGKKKVSAEVESSDPKSALEALLSTPVAEVEKNVTALVEAVEAAQEPFGLLVHMSPDERAAHAGNFRDGESEALLAVLAGVKGKQGLFDETLGGDDAGTNPKRFETARLEQLIAHADAHEEAGEALLAAAYAHLDTARLLRGTARGPVMAAYEILKPLRAHDPAVQSALSTATEFFGRGAAAFRVQRRAKKRAEGGAK